MAIEMDEISSLLEASSGLVRVEDADTFTPEVIDVSLRLPERIQIPGQPVVADLAQKSAGLVPIAYVHALAKEPLNLVFD
ncbi:hypothetical protein GCM10022256_31740 [Frondihabitans peucedani]|uniref:Uncharacterized protein n=1 Tax=Frondihabitans peucedani TaxID=598626 RepID=A0ABP8E5P2_9MICO